MANVADSVMLGHLGEPEGAVRTYLGQERADGTWVREFVGTDRRAAGVSTVLRRPASD